MDLSIPPVQLLTGELARFNSGKISRFSAFSSFFRVMASALDLDLVGDPCEWGTDHLVTCLKDGCAVTNSVNLTYRLLGDGEIQKLSAICTSFSHLRSLILFGNHITSAGVKVLAGSLTNSTTVETLHLGWNAIGKEGAEYLAECLAHNESITDLDLHMAELETDGGIAIAQALMVNKTVRILNVQNNRIGVEGIQSFSDMLHVNQTLQHLNLNSNILRDEGAKHLASAIQYTKSLKGLLIGWTQIGPQGIVSMVKALINNRSVEELNVGGNSIGRTGVSAVAELLKRTCTIKILGMHECDIDHRSVDMIAFALRTNKSLVSLDICTNQVDDRGAKSLAEHMQVNHTVTNLLMKDNPASRSAVRGVLQWVERNAFTEWAFPNPQNVLSIDDCPSGRKSVGYDLQDVLTSLAKKRTESRWGRSIQNIVDMLELDDVAEQWFQETISAYNEWFSRPSNSSSLVRQDNITKAAETRVKDAVRCQKKGSTDAESVVQGLVDAKKECQQQLMDMLTVTLRGLDEVKQLCLERHWTLQDLADRVAAAMIDPRLKTIQAIAKHNQANGVDAKVGDKECRQEWSKWTQKRDHGAGKAREAVNQLLMLAQAACQQQTDAMSTLVPEGHSVARDLINATRSKAGELQQSNPFEDSRRILSQAKLTKVKKDRYHRVLAEESRLKEVVHEYEVKRSAWFDLEKSRFQLEANLQQLRLRTTDQVEIQSAVDELAHRTQECQVAGDEREKLADMLVEWATTDHPEILCEPVFDECKMCQRKLEERKSKS